MMAKINRLGPLAAVVGLLAAVGLLVLMVVEAQPAEAIFPGKNGKIAYVTLTAPRGEEIYTINPDGSGKFRVTNTKNTDEERPGYSPDGKKIAYVRGGNQFFFFQAEDGIRGHCVTGVQTCALPI